MTHQLNDHFSEVKNGERFQFGENWARFLTTLDESRIAAAERSLKTMLGRESLTGLRFIDVGSGSGLFSLAARRLGAKVFSFDFDPQSVQCAVVLRSRYFPDDSGWIIQEGSVLDSAYIDSLGRFDIVYSWGVLHHTGNMWKALDLVTRLVQPGGQLFISIYNDQGYISRRWTRIKNLYCSGTFGRLLVKAVCIPYFVLPPLLLDLVKLRDPTRIYREYKRERGMSKVHDWYDWLGGYPFEVAKPEEIFKHYKDRGFELQELVTCGGGLGCNQFVFLALCYGEMKILYVIGSMEVGGAEQHLLRVAGALAARGWQPTVFALNPKGPLTSAFEAAGVPVRGVSLPAAWVRWLRHPRVIAWTGLLASMFLLVWTYWRLRPRVAHFFLPAAYIVGGTASLLAPRLLRVMSRRSLNHYQAKHRLFRRIELWLHARMDLVCGNSAAVVRDLLSEGVAQDRLRLIYNGIETGRFQAKRRRADVRAELGIQDTAVVMVMVANLIPYKGHADLVQALGAVQASLPPGWVCVCVGRDDGIGASLQEQARAAGIGDHFRFTGSRQDVPDLLAAADVGVLCSHEEGFSNAVIEGMVSGLPMVVTDVGGNAEAVLHGQTGLVVPARNPDLLGTALLKLCSDADQRSQMGLAGRQRVLDHFSMEACVANYEALYGQQLLPTPVS